MVTMHRGPRWKVAVYGRDHGVPHFHIEGVDFRCSVSIASFDVIVTLSPEAHHRALEFTRGTAAEVEYWPMPDPSAVDGVREAKLGAYRQLRDQILARLKARFGNPSGPSP